MTDLGRDLSVLVGGDAHVLARGQVVDGPDGLEVIVGGRPVGARGIVGAGAGTGDAVLCGRVGRQWYVLGPTSDSFGALPRRGTVLAVPGGSEVITVDVAGESLDCPFIGVFTPTVGQQVRLLWSAGDDVPTVLGPVGSVPAGPPPATSPPPPTDPNVGGEPSGTGSDTFPAIGSTTYSLSRRAWNTSYWGRHVVQGSWAGDSSLGVWWYGSRPQDTLEGRTVRAAGIYLPARLRQGNYNASATLHLRLHSQTTQGAGAPIVAGQRDVVIPPNYAGGWHEIPAGWAATIISSGGGVAIMGDPYAGVKGVGATRQGYDPKSGQLRIDWSR